MPYEMGVIDSGSGDIGSVCIVDLASPCPGLGGRGDRNSGISYVRQSGGKVYRLKKT
jgi:hypothetical protein